MRALICCSMLMLTLAACGPSPQSSDQPGASTSSPTAPTEDTAALQAAVAALPAPYNEASYDAGRRVFAQCRSCHTIEAGGPNRVGPNLHGVVGRQAGSLPGFNYSTPMHEAGFVWDASQLDRYLTNPAAAIPGNRMGFAGVRNETQRRDLIAFLQVESAR